MSMRLYEIANEYESILDSLYDPVTGEIQEQALTRLDEVGAAIDQKAIAVASFIQNMEAERRAIDDAKQMMAARERNIENKMSKLKDYLKYNMEKTGKTEISCPYFLIKLKKNPPSTDIFDEDLVPAQYKKVKEMVSVDKNKVKAAILEGKDVPGARVKQDLKLTIN